MKYPNVFREYRTVAVLVCYVCVLISMFRNGHAQSLQSLRREEQAKAPKVIPTELMKQVQVLGARMRTSGREKSAYDLLNELPQHHWDKIVSYRDWDGSADNVLVFALRCSSGRIVLLIVEDPHELAYNDKLMKYELLDAEESKRLESVTPEEWRLID